MITTASIYLSAVDSDGTCRAWLEGPHFQSVGANPITMQANGKTAEQLKAAAVVMFQAGYDLLHQPESHDVSDLIIQEVEDRYFEAMVSKINRMCSSVAEADALIADMKDKLQKSTKVVKDKHAA